MKLLKDTVAQYEQSLKLKEDRYGGGLTAVNILGLRMASYSSKLLAEDRTDQLAGAAQML